MNKFIQLNFKQSNQISHILAPTTYKSYKNLICKTIIFMINTALQLLKNASSCFIKELSTSFSLKLYRNVWIVKAKSTKTRTVIFAWSLLWASVIWLFYSVSSPAPSVSAARCCWHSDGHHSAYANLKHTTGTSHQGHSHIEASGIFLLLHGSCTWCMICKGFI